METRKPSVLLISESVRSSSGLARRLDKHGFGCILASSCGEVHRILRAQKFDLILSRMRLWDGSLYSLIRVLEGTGATLIYSEAVEDGCWWLPALLHGQECFGSSALRQSEFVLLLDKTVREIAVRVRRTTQSCDTLVLRPDVRIASIPRPGESVAAPNLTRIEKRVPAKRKAS